MNPICYMWWDLIPIYGHPEDPTWKETDQTILWVLESTLQLASVACQEGALHGLGHWHFCYRKEVKEIIQRFLQSHNNLREDLWLYAKSASSGHVI